MLEVFVDHKGALDYFFWNGLGFLEAFFRRSFECFGLGHFEGALVQSSFDLLEYVGVEFERLCRRTGEVGNQGTRGSWDPPMY